MPGGGDSIRRHLYDRPPRKMSSKLITHKLFSFFYRFPGPNIMSASNFRDTPPPLAPLRNKNPTGKSKCQTSFPPVSPTLSLASPLLIFDY